MKITSLDMKINGLDIQYQDIGSWYTQVRLAGVPEEVINKGISAIRTWASNNGIHLPQVPGEQQRINNQYQSKIDSEQEKLAQSIRNKENKENEYNMKLLRLGISPEVIARGGIAVRNFAESNGISLPAGEGKSGLNILA